MISKYYVIDLSPGRSLVEWLVAQGQQVFSISWRNPRPENADWDLDRYIESIIEAIETTRQVTGAEKVHVVGLCAGGVVSACTLGKLADVGELDGIAGLTLNVTVLDNERSGTLNSFVSPDTARAAVSRVGKKGYLDKNDLARTFAWLRPNDMIWNYWVNNYLLGNKPPAFDLLYWNSDSMDMPAGLHRDFVEIGVDNILVEPGRRVILGSPIDVGEITTDTYIVAGETDHLTPWPNCYRSVELLERRLPVRHVDRRPHRGGRQPAGQPQGDLPRVRRGAAPDAGGMAPAGRGPQGHLVGGLGRVARAAQRRAAARAEEARQPPAQGPRRRAGDVRGRDVAAGFGHRGRAFGHPLRRLSEPSLARLGHRRAQRSAIAAYALRSNASPTWLPPTSMLSA